MTKPNTASPAVSLPTLGRVRWWTSGDWNGFFGLGTGVLLNVVVLTGLCLTVVQIPPETVYGRILPALGIALPLGNIWYTILARRLAKRENRTDVTALPYGPSVPHTFIVVFVVMLPVLLQSGDPMKAWRAGLAWAFIIGCIVLLGALFGPWIRRITPRAAMLGALAGISITFISMSPSAQMWQAPWVAFVALAFILVGWLGGRRMPFGAPAGLLAVLLSTAVAWIAVALGWSGILDPSAVSESLSGIAVHLPFPTGDVATGLQDIAPLLASAIPLGIYNFTEAMSNVESASAAGDRYSTRQVLTADGLGAIIGSFLGSPFPPAVYVGHPGWKQVGARIGYSLATGVVVGVVCFTGMVGVLLAVFPMQALFPMLLYIGLIIGAQAFDVSPRRYAPAIVLAIVPSLAEWATGLIDNSLAAAGTDAATVGISTLAGNGVIYDGLKLFGQGAVLVGILLGAIACFVIDRRMYAAAVTATLAAALAFIGLINAYEFGFNASPQVTVGYLFLALILAGFGWYARNDTRTELDDSLLFVNGTLMRGLELHDNLAGAEFLEETATADGYRVHSIDDVHPGMYQADDGEGASITGELYQVPLDVLLRVIEGEPDGLYRGPVELSDGRVVPGILYRRDRAERHRDITEYGGWREYRGQTETIAGQVLSAEK
ncbi:gamma-glutamylcyclotransferase [Mycobacterium sp. 21AC1]|uniref:allophanate hydrolase-related protein n=1 Tax=[Mycobacterium] appelbergii TaxID=2939269 RepID=UPI00293936B7|nr:gamma-glutamylcyclotransferase [Mycobacterium sp. 21AC1]MDV3124903.1 gamma-glutamylcyclotransferase [Mycobacterium sp. 21AC1]